MTRRELRESVFKMLFRVDFYEQGELTEQLKLFTEELENLKEQSHCLEQKTKCTGK